MPLEAAMPVVTTIAAALQAIMTISSIYYGVAILLSFARFHQFCVDITPERKVWRRLKQRRYAEEK